MASSHFSTTAYIEVHTLTKGHSDTINSLAYSKDGVYLASGGDDNLVIIWNTQKAQLLYRLAFESSVDCIVWHPVHPETVIVGLGTGYLFQLHDFSLRNHQRHDIHLGVRSTVHCMDYNIQSQCLAIGMGEEVHITHERTQNVYEGDIVLPSPVNREDQAVDFDDRLRVVALQFHRKDNSHLVVSYLAHGVICWNTETRSQVWSVAMPLEKPSIGGSALSPDLRHIAVYNLVDGLDLYAAGAYGKQKPRKTYKFNKPRVSKHALQVQFAHNGRALVCGTTTGGILLWEVRTGDALQELNHGDDIIQTVAVATLPTTSYIATGTAAKGQKTYIKIWRARILGAPGNPDYPENRLFQPTEAVRHGMAIGVTILLCFSAAWICAYIPWLVLRHAAYLGANWSIETLLALVKTTIQRSGDAAFYLSEVWSAFVSTTSASLRQALLTFLFPAEHVDDGMAAVTARAREEF